MSKKKISQKQSCRILECVVREKNAIFNFWSKLSQPSKEQFFTSLKLQAMGIGLVGFVGYIIKLIHIPINNILVTKPDN